MRRLGGLVAAWVATAVVFLAMDATWLTLTSTRLYKAELGAAIAAQPRLIPAVLFYLIYLCGVFGFCVLPARRPLAALPRGAGFGLVAYATYDLTNQATLATWSTRVTLADLAWGVTVTALSATAGAFALSRLQHGRSLR